MPALRWSDTDEIGFQLSQAHPDVDPLTLRFTDLHARVLDLPGFSDDPDASSEGTLESIQMAWAQYARER